MMGMADLSFDKVDAAGGFAVYDVTTGTHVASAAEQKDVYVALDVAREDDVESLDVLLIVALDGEGHRIHSWLASDIYASA